MEKNNDHHQKLKKLFNEVLLNYEAQDKWIETVDPDFINCVETMVKQYDQEISKEEWLRIGVTLGAVYEQWRQQQVVQKGGKLDG